MRQILVIIIFLWTIYGCTPAPNISDKYVDPLMTETAVPGQKFFAFDEIEHYFNDFDETLLKDLYENKSKSELDSLKEGVITGDIPKDMADLSFIDKLEQLGFNKSSVDKSKFADIDNIFSVKPVNDVVFTGCIYVYRDIFIFKKNGRTTGVAKICFGCLGEKIIGTNSNTNYFGQNGDYERLRELVRK